MHRIAAAASGRRALQATATVIALVLLVPLVASSSFAQTMGYALFGYDRAQCGERTDSVQTISGDKVRVCQHRDANTAAFVPGDDSSTDLLFFLGLPGQGNEPNEGLEFSCCSSGENASGRYVGFTGGAFGPVSGVNPVTGTATMTAAYAGHTYATVAQTSTVPLGSSSYVTTWAVTNVSGAPMLVRPFLANDGYGGWNDVAFSKDTATGTYMYASPQIGGAVTLQSSSAAGSPPIAHHQAGSGASLLLQPAHDLDDTLHNPDGSEHIGGSWLAVQWADHTSVPLAAGATANYSVRVTLQQPRSLHLVAHAPGTPPTSGAPTAIDAETRGFTPPAGTPLLWRARGGGTVQSGSITLDGAGHGTFSVPPFAGTRSLVVFADRDGDGQRDADEPEAYGYLWVPRDDGGPAPGGPPTPAPPAGGATVTPTPKGPAGGVPMPAFTPGPAPASPSVSGLSKKVKASRLAKGLTLTLTHLKPRSAVALAARLKTRTVGSAKGKANAKGTAKVTLKVGRRAARRLKGKKLQLRFTVVDAAGARAIVTRSLTVG